MLSEIGQRLFEGDRVEPIKVERLHLREVVVQMCEAVREVRRFSEGDFAAWFGMFRAKAISRLGEGAVWLRKPC
jgi:hypothetical protein